VNLSRLSDMELIKQLAEVDEKLSALDAGVRKLPSPK